MGNLVYCHHFPFLGRGRGSLNERCQVAADWACALIPMSLDCTVPYPYFCLSVHGGFGSLHGESCSLTLDVAGHVPLDLT